MSRPEGSKTYEDVLRVVAKRMREKRDAGDEYLIAEDDSEEERRAQDRYVAAIDRYLAVEQAASELFDYPRRFIEADAKVLLDAQDAAEGGEGDAKPRTASYDQAVRYCAYVKQGCDQVSESYNASANEAAAAENEQFLVRARESAIESVRMASKLFGVDVETVKADVHRATLHGGGHA